MAPLSMKPGRRRNLTMTWLAASLLLTLLSFASLSTSQQTASSLSFRLTLPCPQCFTSAVNRAVVGFSDVLCNPMTSAVPLASCVCLTAIYSSQVSLDILVIAEFCMGVGSQELSFALGVLKTYCASVSQNGIESQPTTTTAAESLTETPNN